MKGIKGQIAQKRSRKHQNLSVFYRELGLKLRGKREQIFFEKLGPELKAENAENEKLAKKRG